MTAHLALDLVWLWLFLRGGALGHGGAIAVTFAACGLHQIVFHPLFACPFVLQLWLGRRWRLAAMYTIAFAAAGVFWILYWQLVLTHEGLHGTGRTGSGIAPFFGEVLDLVGAFGWAGLDLMVKNVTRFLAWQNPIAVALAFVAMANLHKLRRPMPAAPSGRAGRRPRPDARGHVRPAPQPRVRLGLSLPARPARILLPARSLGVDRRDGRASRGPDPAR